MLRYRHGQPKLDELCCDFKRNCEGKSINYIEKFVSSNGNIGLTLSVALTQCVNATERVKPFWSWLHNELLLNISTVINLYVAIPINYYFKIFRNLKTSKCFFGTDSWGCVKNKWQKGLCYINILVIIFAIMFAVQMIKYWAER